MVLWFTCFLISQQLSIILHGGFAGHLFCLKFTLIKQFLYFYHLINYHLSVFMFRPSSINLNKLGVNKSLGIWTQDLWHPKRESHEQLLCEKAETFSGFNPWSLGNASQNKWKASRLQPCLFEYPFPNGVFTVAALSVWRQKIYPYPQKIPLGTVPVTFIVFHNSLFAAQRLKNQTT